MIDVKNLVKTYGGFTAVDDVSFTAQPGRVTGFLGPNGAGKSTCLRIITGLTPPTRGTATVIGRSYADLPNPGRQVGVLLDASAQHAGRTGKEVLTLGAMTMGMPTSRVTEMLDLVGLSRKESERRIRNYSLGMRQRLGLAHALLGDPQVLILDEPANGLDPAGIRWMRDLLGGYAAEGGTVVLSSHLLSEIERIADDIIVIGRGRIVTSGAKEELLAPSGTFVRADDAEALASALRHHGLTFTPQTGGGVQVEAEGREIGHVAVRAGLVLTELRPADSRGLEDIFLSLTDGDARDHGGSSSIHSQNTEANVA